MIRSSRPTVYLASSVLIALGVVAIVAFWNRPPETSQTISVTSDQPEDKPPPPLAEGESYDFKWRVKNTFPGNEYKFEETIVGDVARVWSRDNGSGIRVLMTIYEGSIDDERYLLHVAERIRKKNAPKVELPVVTVEDATPKDYHDWPKVFKFVPLAETDIDPDHTTEELGTKYPHLIVGGKYVVYDPKDKWYHYAGSDVRAMWLGAGKKAMLMKSTKADNGKNLEYVPETQQWIERKAKPNQ